MNSKAIRKQLFAAVAMVLVAAVALGSSTYAWFVASGEVTATGMKVQAQAEAGLVISVDKTTGYASTASATGNAKQLMPASTADGSTWYHAISDNYSDAKPTQADSEYKTDVCAENTHYAKYTFYIKSASANAYNGTFKIKSVDVSNSADQALNKALRVGIAFKDTDTKFYVYAPFQASAQTYKVGGTTGGTEVTAKINTTESVTTITTLPGSNAEPAEVYIYVWYEGEDATCTSANAAGDLSTNTVTVNFEGVQASAGA